MNSKISACMLALFGLIVQPSLAQVVLPAAKPIALQGALHQQQRAPAKKYKLDCSISPDLCITEPVALGCGPGRHWSSAGSGLSHCVEDDRDCKNGKPGKRDEFDNLICEDEKEVKEASSEVPVGETTR